MLTQNLSKTIFIPFVLYFESNHLQFLNSPVYRSGLTIKNQKIKVFINSVAQLQPVHMSARERELVKNGL